MIFFVMRNQYKLAVLIQFTTLLLCLGSLRPMGWFCRNMLKKVLVVTAILRFFKMNAASGEFAALTKDDFSRLLHLLLIIGTLDLGMYEHGMRMKRHRRRDAEQTWKENGKALASTTDQSQSEDEAVVEEASTAPTHVSQEETASSSGKRDRDYKRDKESKREKRL